MSRLARSSPPFVYIAAKATGGRSLGVRQARSARALAEQLRRDRLILLRSWQLPAFLASERKLTLKDHAQLNDQLAQLVARGVPLVEALEVTEQTVRPAAQPIVAQIRERVGAGMGFAEACNSTGVFDTVTIAVYKGAERTGDLAGACKQLALNARRTLAVKGKAATLMIYPSIVLTIGVAVALVMVAWIVPKIGNALAQTGVPLPAYTKVMVAVGMWIRANALLLLLAAMCAAFAGVVWRKTLGVIALHGARHVPLLKDVLLAQESSRFFSVMAAMTRTAVPLADALGVAVHAVHHPDLRKQLTTLRTRLVEGGLLRRLIDEVTTWNLATRRLLIAAERAGDLESAFEGLADDMSAEVDRKSARMLAAFEPLLLVLLFAMIGSLLLSIMIPIMNASSQAF
ncbi:MAG: type II secretion system F family protein [Phycisphaeraceae bacterium]|nr:type II secretion system F family protein [Phycisphaeraceae bacterium]MCW5754861.1 type II secretion system F family protein [Phycisphaeraceae bacterium]